MNFLTENMLEFEGDIIESLLDAFGNGVTKIYSYAVQVNQTSTVEAVCVFTMLLGAALCSLAVGKQIIGTYGFGVQGDPDQDAMEIVFKLCLALGAMGCNSWLFTEVVKFTEAVSSDIMLKFNTQQVDEVTYVNALVTGIDSPVNGIIFGGMVVGIVLFAIASCLRGAEITLSKILLPIFALDLLNSNHEKWNMFIFQYLMSFLSYLVQMLCYEMFIMHLIVGDFSLEGASGKIGPMITLGWLVLSVRSPKILEKYVYATGTGQGISRGAGRLGQVIMFATMRR